MTPLWIRAALALSAALAAVDAGADPWPPGVTLPPGTPVSEDYREQFALCDQAGVFRGDQSRYTRGCPSDPNAVTALQRLHGGEIAFTSKLALDMEGSPYACGPDHGRTDQCPTSLMLRDPGGAEVPVNADAVPYVVIPDAGPPGLAGEFRERTGVGVGDFGVVIANGRTVPVIVADTGPYSKLGEGSLALHRALGHEQCAERNDQDVCVRIVDSGESIASGVTTILFPGSARGDLTPDNIAMLTRREGQRLWSGLQRQNRTAANPGSS